MPVWVDDLECEVLEDSEKRVCMVVRVGDS